MVHYIIFTTCSNIYCIIHIARETARTTETYSNPKIDGNSLLDDDDDGDGAGDCGDAGDGDGCGAGGTVLGGDTTRVGAPGSELLPRPVGGSPDLDGAPVKVGAGLGAALTVGATEGSLLGGRLVVGTTLVGGDVCGVKPETENPMTVPDLVKS